MNNKVGYGLGQLAYPTLTVGRIFVVSAAAGAGYQDIIDTWSPDSLRQARNFTTITDALAACVAGRGDVVLLAPDFTDVPTAAELLSAETKNVIMVPAGTMMQTGEYITRRATANLPQGVQTALFTVTGRVRLLQIVGEVTTVVQTQTNNVKIVANPTVGADVDICAVSDITADAVGSQLSITGTFATALVETPSGAFVSQAAAVVLAAGTLDLSCSASSTGAVKWFVSYIPLDPGARIIAA